LSLRKKIEAALEKYDFDELFALAETEHGIFRILISLAYDKEVLLSWRAIEAVGKISGEIARTDPEPVRNLIGRLLWTIREESGGIGWSAPEMLGEIVRNSPDRFPDIAPIITSFHDEEMLRKGVLRAVARVAEVRPDLFKLNMDFIGDFLNDEDALVRAYALQVAGLLQLKEHVSRAEELTKDNADVLIYEEGDFREDTVRHIAERTITLLKDGED
jgi:hypothetical protein